MKKKLLITVLLIFGIVSVAPAADQIYFELNGGIWFYPGIGGRVGWMKYWQNETIGLICDLTYYNNGFVDELEGGWNKETGGIHNVGVAAGVVFNNMGMNGVIRTMEYIKLRVLVANIPSVSLLDIWPVIDAGFKLNVFIEEKIALSAGIGLDLSYIIYPFPYFSLGMVFTL